MDNIPYAPFVKLGVIGLLLFIIILLLVLAIRVGPMLINKIGNGHKPANGNGERFVERTALREAQKQLDELRAGSQPVQFWLDAYDRSAAKAIQPLLKQNEEMLVLLRGIRSMQGRRQQQRDENENQD